MIEVWYIDLVVLHHVQHSVGEQTFCTVALVYRELMRLVASVLDKEAVAVKVGKSCKVAQVVAQEERLLVLSCHLKTFKLLCGDESLIKTVVGDAGTSAHIPYVGEHVGVTALQEQGVLAVTDDGGTCVGVCMVELALALANEVPAHVAAAACGYFRTHVVDIEVAELIAHEVYPALRRCGILIGPAVAVHEAAVESVYQKSRDAVVGGRFIGHYEEHEGGLAVHLLQLKGGAGEHVYKAFLEHEVLEDACYGGLDAAACLVAYAYDAAQHVDHVVAEAPVVFVQQCLYHVHAVVVGEAADGQHIHVFFQALVLLAYLEQQLYHTDEVLFSGELPVWIGCGAVVACYKGAYYAQDVAHCLVLFSCLIELEGRLEDIKAVAGKATEVKVNGVHTLFLEVALYLGIGGKLALYVTDECTFSGVGQGEQQRCDDRSALFAACFTEDQSVFGLVIYIGSVALYQQRHSRRVAGRVEVHSAETVHDIAVKSDVVGLGEGVCIPVGLVIMSSGHVYLSFLM